MKKLIYIIAVITAVSLVSCEKGLMTFDNATSDVYFSDAGKGFPSLAYDSTYISFGYVRVQDSVKNIIVAVTGSPVPYDREYHVSVNPSSTAIAGTHFVALPEKFVIKKNTTADTIKLKLLKTPDMKTVSYFLTLDLLPNQNFGTNFKTRKGTTANLSTIRTKLRIDDIIKRPTQWTYTANGNTTNTYFGLFSQEKLFFLCDMFDLTPQWWDQPNGSNSPGGAELGAIGKNAQRRLNELAAAGTPVYEADGRLMSMGTASGGTGR